jgi:transposase-like protein
MFRRGGPGERAHAVHLVQERGYSAAAAARVLGRDPRTILRWVAQGVDAEPGEADLGYRAFNVRYPE